MLTAIQDGNDIAPVSVTVAAAPADDGLASTGVDAAPYLWFGGGVVGLGVALVIALAVLRRRNATSDAV